MSFIYSLDENIVTVYSARNKVKMRNLQKCFPHKNQLVKKNEKQNISTGCV